MTEHAVMIAGGGPTGLMLAAELALAHVDVVIVERRTSQVTDGSRAGGLHARSLEVLDQRGVADRFISEGQAYPVFGFAGAPLDMSDLPTRHPCVLGLWQTHIERILADWVLSELAVPIVRGVEVVGLAQDEQGVDVQLSEGSSRRAAYLVGCDGGRSLVRKAAGIGFPGSEPTTSWLIAEVEMDDEPEPGIRRDSDGRQHALGRRDPNDPVRVVLMDAEVEHDTRPDMDELRAALIGIYGTDFGLRNASWISRFTDVGRQADAYRNGRVLLAGDAAHIHPPMGGQGLGTGVQDAVNLGWKLAQVVHGTSPDALLDTYHAERHPVGARVVRNALAQVPLGRADDRHEALRGIVAELVAMDEPRRHLAEMVSGLDVRYDLGEGHPLVGWRMPDLDLQTTNGPTRLFTLLHEARPLLLVLGEPGPFDLTPWDDRVDRVDATYGGVVELPVVGNVPTPPAALLRPDGHVAWAGDLAEAALPESLERWFGAPGEGW
jgi:3-(3-hydroxy-phenyl)propionate hydroxylase